MKQRLTAAVVAIGLIALAACGGHGNGSSTLPSISATPYNGSAALASFDWGKDQLAGAMYLGPVNASHMQVSAVVKQRNAIGLVQYAQQVSDPSSALYRHFLTPQQIGAQFGATQQDYQKAANYFVSQGLTVAGWPQHLALSVAGTQAAMERAFGTKFGLYEKDGFEFVAPVGTPHFCERRSRRGGSAAGRSARAAQKFHPGSAARKLRRRTRVLAAADSQCVRLHECLQQRASMERA